VWILRLVFLDEHIPCFICFIDVCRLVGNPRPGDVDKKSEFFTFEKGVEKTGGGKGFADVWCRGHFAWEYKGPRKDLVAAYAQLQLYREDLEHPRVRSRSPRSGRHYGTWSLTTRDKAELIPRKHRCAPFRGRP
jgi:hypothetical protein